MHPVAIGSYCHLCGLVDGRTGLGRLLLVHEEKGAASMLGRLATFRKAAEAC